MATVTLKVCDRCGDGETRSVATEPFHVEGVSFEVDLCEPHRAELAELQDGLARFATVGRQLEPKRRRHRTASTEEPTAADTGGGSEVQPEQPERRVGRTDARSEENREIRAWARGRGFDIGDRGRIPDELREQYQRWRWEQDHPFEEQPRQPPPRPVGIPVRDIHPPRPVPSPPPRHEERPRLDPASALVVHSESAHGR